MTIPHAVAWFFAGWFLTNALPHGVAAVQGRAFQTPFASPPGVGLSSSRLNVVWAAINVATGWALLTRVGAFSFADAGAASVFFAGAVCFAWFLAGRFGRFYGGNDAGAARSQRPVS